MVFKVIADIVNTSFWHWLSFVIERVRPNILGRVILPEVHSSSGQTLALSLFFRFVHTSPVYG